MKHLKIARILAWLSVLFFAAVGILFKFNANLDGPAVIMNLDRDGVINADAVKAHYPELAGNLRRDLGIYVTKDLASSGTSLAYSALAFSIATALYLTLGRQKSKNTSVACRPAEDQLP